MVKELPFWGQIIYGIPEGGIFLVNQIITAWIFYFYTTGALGGEALVPPAIVGTIIFLGRLVDAVADPVIARFSDNFDSKWGRRMPFMAVSGVILVGSFIALFHPLVEGQSTWNALYLICLVSIYFASFTAYVCPYLALLPELATSTAKRVNLATYKAIFRMLGTGIALIGAGIIIGKIGFQNMAWIMGILALVLLYIPMSIREKEYAQSKPATLGLIEAIKKTLQNRPFVFYLVGCIAFWFGGNIVLQAAPFYVTVLLEEGEAATSLFYGAAGVIAVISFPIINYIAKKKGLKTTMLLSMFVLIVLLPLVYFLGKPLWGIDYFTLALIGVGLAGFPVAALFIVPDALVASISDLDEKLTGQHRQAMYFGTQGLIMKGALGLSTVVMGTLFQTFGQTPAEPLGVQLTGPVAAFLLAIGFIVFLFYPEKEVLAYQQQKLSDES